MSVRSALIRVRWNDIPVRREDSSTEIRSGEDFEVVGSIVPMMLAEIFPELASADPAHR
jgi:hypothetical protein